MKIKYMTPEAETRHIAYETEGNTLTVDYLSFKLDRIEKDYDIHMDICRDKFGNLSTGVIPGLSMAYVAQIDIPARTYHETDSGEMTEEGDPIMVPEADPYDPEKTTLTLWETEE